MKTRSLFKKLISALLAVLIVFSSTAVLSFAETTQAPQTPPAEEVPPVAEKVDIRTRTVDTIVEAARSKIGFYESTINEFTTWYYGTETEAQWCTIFVSWCADQGNALGVAVPKRATVESMKKWFVNRNKFYHASTDYVPQKGDIVFLNTATDGTDAVHHVEIVTESGFITSNKTKSVKCIGGNTSDLNYNGSEYVTEKVRPVNSSRATIVGYAHPAYERRAGILNLFVMLADDTLPSFFKTLYAKILEIIIYLSRLGSKEPVQQSIIF